MTEKYLGNTWEEWDFALLLYFKPQRYENRERESWVVSPVERDS